MSTHIGTGWGFPPRFNKSKREVELVSGEAEIRSSLAILFATALGERVMRPDFGSDLHELMFDPLDAAMEAYVLSLVETAIEENEPRIELMRIEIEKMPEEGLLNLHVEYEILPDYEPGSFVYPFYLQ